MPLMTYRVDRVQAVVTFYVDFEGTRQATIDYVPAPGDQLAAALLAKADELNRAEIIAAGPVAQPLA
jgi:hypothetical protein